MGQPSDAPPAELRRRALAWAHANGAWWSIGNALTTGNLINYLAQDLGAQGLGLSLILAAPALAGLLRLGTPGLIRRLGSARRVALVFSLAAYLLLLGLPLVGWADTWLPGRSALSVLVALICVHQLLEAIGTVALWTWLGGLVPPAIRGRYFARRQMWQLLALLPAVLVSAWFVDYWKAAHPQQLWVAYAAPNALGALALLASLGPLVAMPASLPARPSRRPLATQPLAPWYQSLANGTFVRLVLFGSWVGFFNGITQAAQGRFPYQVLALGLVPLQAMLVTMRLGQLALSPWVGWLSDRFGNRPVLIASQLCVSVGPLFYLAATPSQPYWIWGAWLAWSAFVGLNICLPNLTLKLSPGRADPGYIATYFALTTLVYAVGTLVGGQLLDRLSHWPALAPGGSWGRHGWGHYQVLFAGGALARLLGVLWLVGLAEPGAARLAELWSHGRNQPGPSAESRPLPGARQRPSD